jgi:hypothetical protein
VLHRNVHPAGAFGAHLAAAQGATHPPAEEGEAGAHAEETDLQHEEDDVNRSIMIIAAWCWAHYCTFWEGEGSARFQSRGSRHFFLFLLIFFLFSRLSLFFLSSLSKFRCCCGLSCHANTGNVDACA